MDGIDPELVGNVSSWWEALLKLNQRENKYKELIEIEPRIGIRRMPSIEDNNERQEWRFFPFVLCQFDCDKKSKEGVITLVACDRWAPGVTSIKVV